MLSTVKLSYFHISSSSYISDRIIRIIFSEIYEVLDTIFKDRGTSTDYGTWDNVTYSASEINRGDDYTTLTPDSSWERIDKTISDSNDFVMEFDVNYTYSESSTYIRYYDGSTIKVAFNYGSIGLQSGQWYNVKLERNGDTITPIVDGVRLTNKAQTFTGSINKFSLISNNTRMTNMKYKNFVYYPI